MQTETAHMSPDSVLPRLNSVRLLVVMAIAFGYASTMSISPNATESARIFGYEPSWLGIQILFFFSGALAYRSLSAGRNGWRYLKSRIWRVFPLLLAITLITVLVIYPMLGKPLSGGEDILALAKYFFLTASCLDPGRPLPGLMDDAVYMCLIQGAIWTLRWGLLIHIAVIIAARFKTLLKPRIILGAAILSMLTYAMTAYLSVKMNLEYLRVPLVGFRLGYVFILGMAVWAYRNHIPQHWLTRLAIGGGLFAFAAAHYTFVTWTPLIEVAITLSLGYGAWLVAMSKTPKLAFLNNWPHLALGMYLINWPTAQVLLHEFPDLGRWSLPALSLPLSILLTLLSYWALTGRINRFIESRLLRKVPVQAASL